MFDSIGMSKQVFKWKWIESLWLQKGGREGGREEGRGEEGGGCFRDSLGMLQGGVDRHVPLDAKIPAPWTRHLRRIYGATCSH